MLAYILCGGAGTRLQSVLRGGQKALADVAGVPFLSFVLKELAKAGVSRAVLCAHYRADQLLASVPALSSEAGIALELVCEPEPYGTGGALVYALSKTRPKTSYIVLNADTYLEAPAYCLALESTRDTMIVTQVDDRLRFGSVVVDPLEGRVLALREKGESGPGLISVGVYRFAPDTLMGLAAQACSMETNILPFLANQGQLYAREYRGNFVDIGVPDSYLAFQQMMDRSDKS